MTIAYVLIGERGEYEDFTREVLGVFSSRDAACDAIPKLRVLGARRWAQWQERDTKRKDYLKRFEPAKIYPAGSVFPGGHISYTNAQYEEAEKACGDAPRLIVPAENYLIESYDIDAIDTGSSVEEIGAEQAAAVAGEEQGLA